MRVGKRCFAALPQEALRNALDVQRIANGHGERLAVEIVVGARLLHPLRLAGSAVHDADFRDDLSIQDFNPFLASNDDRGKEVHLPGYAPTAKANAAYFGTGDDDTNPGIGKYYQSKTNLPWAMDISATFDYPKEKIPVT